LGSLAFIAGLTVGLTLVATACKPPSKPPARPVPPGPLKERCLKPNASCAYADLAHLDLRGLDLHNADLHGSKFIGADLSGANLVHTNLQGADFTSARLIGTKLLGADLQEALLPDTTTEGVDFRLTKFRGAIIGARFNNANFTYANLVGALEYGCQSGPACCQKEYLAGDNVRCPDGTIDTGTPESWVHCKGHIYVEGWRHELSGASRQPDSGQTACANLAPGRYIVGPVRAPPESEHSF
jgi:hypothetical protein